MQAAAVFLRGVKSVAVVALAGLGEASQIFTKFASAHRFWISAIDTGK